MEDWGPLIFLVPSLPSPYKIQNGGREVVVREKGFTSGPLSIMALQLRNARVFTCFLRQYSVSHFSFQVCCRSRRQVSSPGEVLLGILGWGLPPGSSNPDPISDQKMSSSTPVFRPDLYNPYPFADLAFGPKLCHYY